ncbi:uracil-xanthine permease [Klebsiella variicola]|nr:uracil-xanthine permease [Klebsiella variicola]
MSDEHHSGLLYGLEQRIPPLPAFFSALQHVLAGLVGIITPPLIIGATLGLGDWLPYLISMSLLASGIGTFLQSNRVGGVGAGMICMQGTSFAFLGVTVAGGMWVKAQGGGPQDMMAMLFGVNFVAALVPVIVSRFIEPLKKIFTPIITGSVIALIGISLIKVSVINWCGGEKAEDFASMSNIALGRAPSGYRPAELRQKPLAASLLGGGGHCRGLRRGRAERSVPSSQPGRHSVSPADAVSVRLSV